jgi:transposase
MWCQPSQSTASCGCYFCTLTTDTERAIRIRAGYNNSFTRGATKEGLHLHSQTVQAIAEEYATRRRQFRKVRLSWRKSTGSRRSLGWIPFKKTAIQAAHGQVKFAGQWLSLWDSYGLDSYQIRASNFCEDARGRWYLNGCVAEPATEAADRSPARGDVGIDLGLKDLAATSAGETLAAPQFYRGLEAKLAIAQRAGKKNRVRAIHAKIANRRRDSLRQLSWTRHRLRAIQLKHWRVGTTIYSRLRGLGATHELAAQIAGGAGHWWGHREAGLNRVLTVKYFDNLGIPQLT